MRLNRKYWGGRFVMYRCYDADDRLLYVGATSSLADRLEDHRNQAEWFTAHSRLRVQVFGDYADALAAERAAIRAEAPLFNVRSAEAGARRIKQDPRRIRPAGPELIRDFLDVHRVSVRDLAEMCGGAKHRAAIGHLLSGWRDTCNGALAEALQDVIYGEDSDVALFESPRHLRAVS